LDYLECMQIHLSKTKTKFKKIMARCKQRNGLLNMTNSVVIVLVASLCVRSVSSNMYDVIEPHKQAPACGCADWSSLGNFTNALFAAGKVPANAGNSCAQPGKVVNTYTLGSWCYCKNTSDTVTQKAPPSDHPYDGQLFLFQDLASSRYVSFASADSPPGVATGGSEWMRVNYPQTEAVPILMKAVVGKPNTYTLFNDWSDKQDQYYFSFTWDFNWVRSIYDETDAMPVELVIAGQGKGDGVFKMKNQWPTGNYGYLGYGDSPYWLSANVTEAQAMTVKLIPTTAPPPNLKWGYCTSTKAVPEQVNVQAATADTVVISFVTFEETMPTSPPIAMVRLAGSTNSFDNITGVTHTHVTATKDRTYYMHFVKVTALQPRQAYEYSVKSGGAGATASDTFSFRAHYASGITSIALYGDMGVYEWNNMANLYQECVVDKTVDMVIHMGDHAYNEGESDEERGDAYMSAFQPTLANCPWMPIVGNHEYYDGAELGRYLNQTWEGWGKIPGGPAKDSSALGMFLATGNKYSSGSHGSLPSGTSRFFSADIGLVHLVAIDLNSYYGVDPCGPACQQAQLVWLKQDLAAANANRAAVPWVVVMSDYPFYCTGCYAKQVPAQWYESAEAERHGNVNHTLIDAMDDSLKSNGKALRASSDASIAALMPIIQASGVDMYLAGHWHYYESLWPAQNGATGSGGAPIQKNFINPKTTVHVTTGNGGPPGADTFNEDCPGPDCGSIKATRVQSNAFGYGKLIAHNATHLEYKQILNNDSSVFDMFMLIQQQHGPFPPNV